VDGEPERIEAKAEDGSLVFEAGGPGRYAVLGSDTPFSVSAIIQPDPLPGDEKEWKRRLHRSVGRDTGGCPAGAAAGILIQEKAEGTG